jgi:hypothetical protein
MNKTNVEKIAPGPELDALVAENLMGWKDIQRQADRCWGKKQDRAGRWRRSPVPDYSTEPGNAYLVEERIKELGLSERYGKELAKITHAMKVPTEWASPDQRCRAALRAARIRK